MNDMANRQLSDAPMMADCLSRCLCGRFMAKDRHIHGWKLKSFLQPFVQMQCKRSLTQRHVPLVRLHSGHRPKAGGLFTWFFERVAKKEFQGETGHRNELL